MFENSMKLRVAIVCWLLIFCWALPRHVDGAEQHTETIEEILRSVAEVRAQLEPIQRNRMSQRRTYLPPAATVGPDGTGASRRMPGLLSFIRGAPGKQPSGTTPPIITISSQAVPDVTHRAPPVTTTLGPLSAISARRRIGSNRPATPPNTNLPATTRNDDLVRANPLGLVIPRPDQVNFFQRRPQQPYGGSPTSTRQPPMVDFYFPRGSEEDLFQPADLGATRLSVRTESPTPRSSVQSSTSTTATPATIGTTPTLSATLPTSKVTIDPVEEETTEPEEEGLGNRIDQKVLLSLLG